MPLAALAFLHLAPGLLFLALLPQAEARRIDLAERVFVAIGVSVTVSAWVALVLAAGGFFSLRAVTLVVATVCSAVALLRRERLTAPLPFHDLRSARAGAVVALAGALFLAPIGENIVGGRDSGVYVATMALVSRTGALVQPDSRTAVPPEDADLFRTAADGGGGGLMGVDEQRPGRVVPQFFHLFPAWGALYFSAGGVQGALACSSAAAMLGLLGVFFTVRRLWSERAAVLAALILSVNVVQIWFARNAASETLSQALIFLGLLALARWQEEGSTAFGVLGGAAFGMALLTRIDNVLILPGLTAMALVHRLGERHQRRRLLPVLAPLALLATHAVLHALVFSRAYAGDILGRRALDQPAVLAAVAALALMLAVLAAELAPERAGEWVAAHDRELRQGAMLLVVVLALHAAFLRPMLSAWAGGAGHEAIPFEGALAQGGGGRAFLRTLGYQRLSSADAHALLRFGWFVTPLGLVLASLGLLATLRDGRARHALLLSIALSFSLFYFYKMRISSDYLYASRRFLPVILPCAVAYAAVFLDRQAGRGRLGRAIAAVLAVVLLAVSARPSLALRGHVEWAGATGLVARIARHVEAGDIVVFEPPDSTHLVSLPLWALHGVDVVQLATWRPDPARIEHLVAERGRRHKGVLFVHTESLSLCCVPLQPLERVRFDSGEWERTGDRIPARAEPRSLRFNVSRARLPD